LEIKELEVLQSLHAQFPLFKKQPLKFWELHNTALQPYDNEQASKHRAKIFLLNAVQLESNIQKQEILQRLYRSALGSFSKEQFRHAAIVS
jgi:hypothetical protein